MKRVAVSFVLAAVVAVALAPSAGSPRTIRLGVTIAGLNAAGLDAEQARQLVTASFGRPLRFRFGKKRWQVSPARLGAEPLVDEAVSRALRARPSDFEARVAVDAVSRTLRPRRGEDVEVRVAVDNRRVWRYVEALDRRFSVPARDAQLAGLRNLRPVIAEAREGRALRRSTLAATITRMLRSGARPRVRLVMKPLQPGVTRRTFGPVIVIRRDSKRLVLYRSTRLVRTFKVATGRAQYPTPTGTFSIVDMQRNPWWRPPDSDWARGLKPIPPGPGNPLGTRWMGTSAAGVGIHGTPDAASVGYSASHGCIRMYIPDADWLFNHVRIGTPVAIVAA